MKNYFETTAFVMSAKEFQYSKGVGYNFSFAMRGEAQSEDKNSAPIVWISGVSFNQQILDKRNYLFRGKLQVKPPYKDYPAGLQLVVSEAILLESGMYVVSRKKQEGSGQAQTAKPTSQITQDNPQQQNTHQEVSQPQPVRKDVTSHSQQQTVQENYRDPVAQITVPDSEIPF